MSGSSSLSLSFFFSSFSPAPKVMQTTPDSLVNTHQKRDVYRYTQQFCALLSFIIDSFSAASSPLQNVSYCRGAGVAELPVVNVPLHQLQPGIARTCWRLQNINFIFTHFSFSLFVFFLLPLKLIMRLRSICSASRGREWKGDRQAERRQRDRDRDCFSGERFVGVATPCKAS